MAALTAIMLGLGGYNQGRQQRLQNQQNQEQIDQQGNYQNAELGIKQQDQKNKQQAQQRLMGIDPTTGLPFQVPKNLQQVAPNNKGKAATDAQTLTHLYAYANWLNQTGQDPTPVLDRAKAMEADIRANNSLMQRDTLDLYNQDQMNQRSANSIAGALQRNTNTEGGANSRSDNMIAALLERALIGANTSTQNNIRTTNTSRANTAAHIQQQLGSELNNDMSKYEHDNATAVSGKKPLPYPNLPYFKAGQAAAIAAITQDPSQLPKYLKILNTHAQDFGDTLLLYGQRQLKDAAAAAKQASQAGGSSTTGNPTNGGYRLPQRSIWDMLIQNGATPDEATKLSAIAYAESGGDPTSVNPTDNHGKQTSWGLFQISDGTHNEPKGWQDPVTNTRMAIAKLRSKQGLHAWGTYNSGAYEQYLPGGK